MKTALPVAQTPLAARLTALVLTSLVLVGVAVFPQLSARIAGDEYLLRVAPLDPIEPARGAYVALGYPDLNPRADGRFGPVDDGAHQGTVFLTLEKDGEYWKGKGFTRSRPDEGVYLQCSDRNWAVSCGIESWFLPQDEAAEMEQAVSGGTATAVVRIDGRGHAALVDVRTD
ncbi:MAG: GDYXXLXY domain-containing protein [Nocardioides sp.]